MTKLVIFDLDGTLVNTISDLADSVNFALQKNGFSTHEESEFPSFVGNGIYKLIERALPKNQRDTETIKRVKVVFMEYYTLHNTDKSKVYPEVDELLTKLTDKGISLAVASNKVHLATLSVIHHFFGEKFACILGQRDEIPTKPNPAIVFEILDTLGIKKSEVLYVGDSGVDMQTAHNAGLTAVGVSWGLRTREELKKNNADFIIDYPLQLLELVGK